MLTFKKGSYNLRDLTALYDALEAGKKALCAINADSGCSACNYRKVCADLLSTQLYVRQLMSEETSRYVEHLNQRTPKNHS